MNWNPISGRFGPGSDLADNPIARAKAAREICDYLLDELARLGIEDAVRLVDAAAAALDEWLQDHKVSGRKPARPPADRD
jgi:hypothetical protein